MGRSHSKNGQKYVYGPLNKMSHSFCLFMCMDISVHTVFTASKLCQVLGICLHGLKASDKTLIVISNLKKHAQSLCFGILGPGLWYPFKL